VILAWNTHFPSELRLNHSK